MQSVAHYPEELRDTPRGRVDVQVTHPAEWHVVMGAGGKAEREVHPQALSDAGIPLFKRKGGGGTVLLGPNTLVITVHAGVGMTFANLAYFSAINEALMRVMRTWKDLPYRQRGISDIALTGRKLVGSSIFRRRQYLLYQASMLVELNLDLMDHLLRMPPRQPDYRNGRTHRDFVTCLRDVGVMQSYGEMTMDLERQLPPMVLETLAAVDRRQMGE